MYLQPGVKLYGLTTYDFSRQFLDNSKYSLQDMNNPQFVQANSLMTMTSFTVMSWFYSDSTVTQDQVVVDMSTNGVTWDGGLYFLVKGNSFPKTLAVRPACT